MGNRFLLKEKLPEPNRIVILYGADKPLFTFRTDEETENGTFERGSEYMEWEYSEVDLESDRNKCPLEMAMEQYEKREIAER